MRHFIILFLLVLFTTGVYGQSTDQNHIKTTVYKVADTTSISSPSAAQAAVSVTYYDGLGRAIQQNAHRQSNTGKDIITHIEYDIYGRQVKDHLPYAATTAGLQFRSDAQSRTGSYYNTAYYENTLNPYSEKQLEASPLNRVLKQATPGNPWAMGSGKEIKMEYKFNSANEVKLYKATATWAASVGAYNITLDNASGTVYYPADELHKTITKDENWTSGTAHTTEEFKDKEGRVVLKRSYGKSVVSNVVTFIAHDTYYVYDVYGNLTYVIPPLVDTSQAITATVLDDLCYQYKYDSRNRLVEKKLPGKGWEYIVYDKLDRVVATGPALNPFTDEPGVFRQGWLFTKYDAFSRPVLTGWAEIRGGFDSTARYTLQNTHNTRTVLHESKPASDNSINGVSYRYTNVAHPTTNYHILTVNYYDDYNYTGAPTSFGTVEGEAVYYNNTTPKPKGLPTGSWVRVLEGKTQSARELSWMLYDKKGRVIRNRTENHLGGYTQTDSKLDFTGKALYTVTLHKRISSDTELYVKDSYTYSDQDRLLTHTHQIGTGGTPQLLAKNEYDELGQLLVKRVGGTDVTGNTPMQKVDYSYNIRGWLKEINKVDNLTQGSDPTDLFAFKINYDTPANTLGNTIPSLYNGNISETLWKTNSDNQLRSYSYRYDELNRLQEAVYHKQNVVQNSYNELLTYDKNGNIKTLERNGDLDTQTYTINIDYLNYTYSGNRLIKVEDFSNHPEGFTDGADTAQEYGYDAYGNMIRDDNKGITAIRYNHLNLPVEIIFNSSSTKKITYIYNATGTKVHKLVEDVANAVSTETDYLNGYQYEDTIPVHFPTAEGYVKVTIGRGGYRYSYVYNYTDHLGNIRLRYTSTGLGNVIQKLEENHYYPFGLKHKKYNSYQYVFVPLNEIDGYDLGIDPLPESERDEYQYKYNGKEFQDELGLNVYDYGMRNYMPDLGRWGNIDPKAELLERSSPYVYALNSPLIYVDKDGELPILINGKTMNDSERADVSYWTASIVNTIKNSGIANPGGEVHFVDGNRGHRWDGRTGGQASQYDNAISPSRRAQGGRYAADGDWQTILSKLARDPETGKIVEKIQIYTHSRGAAFGVGYTERLLELIKENSSQFADAGNVIDFVYNMAPHQSGFLTAPDGVDSYSHDHTKDWLSGNDMKGVKGAFTSNEGSGGIVPEAHYITGFQNDLKAFTSAFLKGGTSQDIINNFIKTMKDTYGITVTVQQ